MTATAEILADNEIAQAFEALLNQPPNSERWAALKESGAGDRDIRATLTHILGAMGKNTSQNGIAAMQARPVLALWIGAYGGASVTPTLTGDELVDAVREHFRIPQWEFISKIESLCDTWLDDLKYESLTEIELEAVARERENRKIPDDARGLSWGELPEGEMRQALGDEEISDARSMMIQRELDCREGHTHIQVFGVLSEGVFIPDGNGLTYDQLSDEELTGRIQAIESRNDTESSPEHLERLLKERNRRYAPEPEESALPVQGALFDYGALDEVVRAIVRQKTLEIKALVKQTAESVILIGKNLLEVKDQLRNGSALKWRAWLESEFTWTEQTARRFMHVAEKFGGHQVTGFAPSALYLLAAPSTPETAREEALSRAEEGEPITHKAAEEIVERAKAEEDGKQMHIGEIEGVISDGGPEVRSQKSEEDEQQIVASSPSPAALKADDAIKRYEDRRQTKVVDKTPTIEELLKDRPLTVTFAFGIPGVPNKVNVGVCVGSDRTKTVNKLFNSSEVKFHNDDISKMIAGELAKKPVASKPASTPKRAATPAKKSPPRTPAKKAASARPTKKATPKKGAKKGAK